MQRCPLGGPAFRDDVQYDECAPVRLCEVVRDRNDVLWPRFFSVAASIVMDGCCMGDFRAIQLWADAACSLVGEWFN